MVLFHISSLVTSLVVSSLLTSSISGDSVRTGNMFMSHVTFSLNTLLLDARDTKNTLLLSLQVF